MQHQPNPVRHWPGGIPPWIRIHPDGERSEDVEIEDSRGWLLFVKEAWRTREDSGILADDTEYELRQRRFLIEIWASAEQSFRDFYHYRAPLPGSPFDYPKQALDRIAETKQRAGEVYTLALVTKDHPRNYTRWLKIQIMLYRLDGEYGHLMHDGNCTVVAEPNPATARPEGLHKTEFLSWKYLETADFDCLTMTRSGMVRFLKGCWRQFVIDQYCLETGLLSLVDFLANGQIEVELLRRPFNLISVMNFMRGLGWSVGRMKFENTGGPEWANEPMEMDDPILDILETALDLSEMVDVDGDRDQFAEDIELYAPGYLDMEAAGRAEEYDVAWLRDGEEAAEIYYARD
ncbi:uncharacterized protein N7496_008667 [Penicillium cataractarum]|uniref:Uncharacterized protein n=1 Tax=Penicillium cataractarum TaxID=2100454 RepID=A0A9W9V4Y6_9EURO|nr:uncharacterized protein N7496_008667 [Penicillium cataractarum]KAJ5368907.1 hypothetical protein N7496_008667 [Penicillium cataractarum]